MMMGGTCVTESPESSTTRPASWAATFGAATWATVALIVSGLLHLGLYGIIGADWEGAVAPRKPGLFGISAGLTACSLMWCARVLETNGRLIRLAATITWALFAEVTLITVQYWRGVPSHFNRSTWLDAAIELSMVALILTVTLGIAWTYRISMNPTKTDPGTLLAIQAGLAFLLISCLLGIGTMICGEFNIAGDRPAEYWGRAGVLKYPHGAALHALQTIPILNWLLRRFHAPRRILLIQTAIAAQAFFLVHALWQTGTGRSRFDTDAIGTVTLFTSFLLLGVPIAGLVKGASSRWLAAIQRR